MEKSESEGSMKLYACQPLRMNAEERIASRIARVRSKNMIATFTGEVFLAQRCLICNIKVDLLSQDKFIKLLGAFARLMEITLIDINFL